MNALGQTPTHATVRREDYRSPDWLVPEVELEFDLDPTRTEVRARLRVKRNGEHDRPLRLDWEAGELLGVSVDGVPLNTDVDGDALLVPVRGETATVETRVAIAPETNTQLMGLYASGGLLCTQCEAEGFRRITPFPDRPDVLARYRVILRADRSRFPVLLCNGDKVGEGELPDGRHWAEWHDPFPKPSYLFALVAGDLQPNRDTFTTVSGRQVQLAIWVAEADLARTHHAMRALKDAMAWDEREYGREYDLGEFNIVAVSDFNFGAMENKGLNIFNARYVLADPETATDADHDAVATVVAHEYFHNWSGNRVTCRDWFQLSLKEGFTVFRDQGFTEAHGSPAVARIEQVRSLRAAQFPEDAGPLAHPIRPDSYIEISNFYTATVYQKGAEIVRMIRTLIGPEEFRAGADLYFARHDGEAATCEEFIRAMEEASGVDLAQFRRWYATAGTPRVHAQIEWDEVTRRALVRFEQSIPDTPGQTGKAPLAIPLRTALFGRTSGHRFGDQRLILLADAGVAEVWEGVDEPPLLSTNRGFSAPVIIESAGGPAALAAQAAVDDDPFARWDAMQELCSHTLVAATGGKGPNPAPIEVAIGRVLDGRHADPALSAETVMLPTEAAIAERLDPVHPDRIHRAREALRLAIGRVHVARWREILAETAPEPHGLEPADKGRRRLRAIALGYLFAAEPDEAGPLALGLYRQAGNMTERIAALSALANSDAPEREEALADFHDRAAGNGLLLDKWFGVQAMSIGPDTTAAVARLTEHPDFTLANPNRARSLLGAFAANQNAFHAPDGAGYRLLAAKLLELDRLNPQTAAKLVTPLGRWRRFEEGRATLMKRELEALLAAPGLSRDLFEQVSKSLA